MKYPDTLMTRAVRTTRKATTHQEENWMVTVRDQKVEGLNPPGVTRKIKGFRKTEILFFDLTNNLTNIVLDNADVPLDNADFPLDNICFIFHKLGKIV